MLGFSGLHGSLPCAKAQSRAHAASAMKADVFTGPKLTRRAVLSGLALSAVGAVITRTLEPVAAGEVADPALNVKVVTKGTGAKVGFGDLVAIRFKGSYKDIDFDNIFDTPEPYFYRAGSGLVLKGIDQAVLGMHVGDVVELDLPPELAFGSKGRRASAGKPSIPGGATVHYKVALTSIPGKDEELLEVTGGSLDE